MEENENHIDEIRELDVYVGKRLREKRQKLGMTLAYVAETKRKRKKEEKRRR